MSRPAVIIGLGGTGQWVLTYLKKDLLELNNGRMPENVRLLAFDTVTQAEASKTTVAGEMSGEQATYEKQTKRIGTVELTPDTELIHIGGDCLPLANAVENGEHPHLDWFDVKYWKEEAGLGRDNWILDRGAGRFRQFGLLAVYKDLLGGAVRSKILRFLPAAIRDVRAAVNGDTSFELIVVGSIAGGTGSAMLIPFGVLARKLFGDALVRTRALVVLPSAFSQGKASTELELRGGAALRELARAMMPPTGYTSFMNFLPDSEYERVPYSRPFDGVYFIDGTRNGQPINKDPRQSVFPAVSGWIRQIIDEESGMWFTNFVSTNRAGTDRTRSAEGVFGVFGVKSFYAPVRSLRQTYRLKIVNQVLQYILDPKTQGTGGTRVANNSPSNMPRPTDKASQILTETASFGDIQQVNTPFLSKIANLIALGGPAHGDGIAELARAGWDEGLDHSWQSVLPKLPNTKETEAILTDAENEFGQTFERAFPLSKDPGSNATYIRNTQGIDSYMHERHGGMGAGGKDDYGRFGLIANACAKTQMTIFRNLLRMQVLSLLSANQGKGQIGYTVEVLKQLENIFNQFEEMLQRVETQRSQLSPQADLQQKVGQARAQWTAKIKEEPSLLEKLQGKPSQTAVRAERALLSANRKYVNYIREVTLHNAAKTATREMKEHTRRTRMELERWIVTMLEGDHAQNITGLLTESENNLKRVLTTIQEDIRSNEVEELVQVGTREAKIAPADEEWAVSGLSWVAEEDQNGLKFRLLVNPVAERKGVVALPDQDMTPAQKRQVEGRNLNELEAILEQNFGKQNQVQDIILWSSKTYSPEDLATILHDATSPMTWLHDGARPVLEAFNVSIKKDVDPDGFSIRLQEQMRMKTTGSVAMDNNHPVEVVGSEDPYRLTAVRTQVGLKLDEFQTWKTLQATYERELGKVKIALDTPDAMAGESPDIDTNKKFMRGLQSQYLYFEEKQAVALEVKWREDGRAHRLLGPRMVSLMGESQKLKIALQCWALGWITLVEDVRVQGQFHWELKVPDFNHEIWLTKNSGKKDDRDEFQAMESFVLVGLNNARGRENVPLNWNGINQAIGALRKSVADKEANPWNIAMKNALAENGLVERWKKQAGEEIDMKTGKSKYTEPAYHDLSDYAERFFRGLEV